MLPDQAHVSVGGVPYRLDEAYERATGRRCYDHYLRSLFSGRTDITGRPGAQNLNPDNLVWQLTEFNGEGQVVLNPDDPTSATRFYRSEGLDFRTPGEFKLNKSTVAQNPPSAVSGSTTTTTIQGSALVDVTGTYTTVNTTDAQLNVLNDKVRTASLTPGARRVETRFYLYRDGVISTTIAGSALKLQQGSGDVVGSDFVLREAGSACRTVTISSLTAGAVYRVTAPSVFASSTTVNRSGVAISVWDVTNTANPFQVASDLETVSGSSVDVDVTFTAVSGHSYQFRVRWDGAFLTKQRLVVDAITYEVIEGTTEATISVYNATGAVEVANKVVQVNATNSALVDAIVFTAAAATAYQMRVQWTAGTQKLIVDKAVWEYATASTDTYTIDAIELGQGGKVWACGHGVGATQAWYYDFTAEQFIFEAGRTFGTANDTVLALAHSDKYEYALTDGGRVVNFSATDAAANYLTGVTDATGMCIAQDRLFLLREDSAGSVNVNTYGVDSGSGTAVVQAVTTARVSANAAYRQRMVGTPSGARFFVNYSSATAAIYEADASGASLVVREIARLDPGTVATAISYAGGITFITGQFIAETGETARSALWIIDANGIIQRVGYFRRDDPNGNYPGAIVPYQNDVYIQQGMHVWRYSLVTGGLFCEYELQPPIATSIMGDGQRGLAVLQGHSLAAFTTEVYVTGSVDTYRQAGVSGANKFTSSIYDFGLPGFKKTLTKIQVLTATLPANTSVLVEYQKDGDGTWTTVGVMDTGSIKDFFLLDNTSYVEFNAIQVRVTPRSKRGTNTPTVRAIVVYALPAEDEEFFDLAVWCYDEDSSFHINGQQLTGQEQAANLVALARSKVPTTFLDGYAYQDARYDSYSVRVDSIRDQRNQLGEGRVVATLRVIR